jgi:hypothetical protein
MKHTTKILIYSLLFGAGLVAAQTAIDLAQIRNALIPIFVDAEVPIGAIPGTSFNLAFPPNAPTSLHLYRNGLRQQLVNDYTLSGVVITFTAVSAPEAGDTILADYRH